MKKDTGYRNLCRQVADEVGMNSQWQLANLLVPACTAFFFSFFLWLNKSIQLSQLAILIF